MKRGLGLLLAAGLIFVEPTAVSAHGGRTNASGCHRDRSSGDGHCHNGGTSLGDFSIGKSKKKKKSSKRRR